MSRVQSGRGSRRKGKGGENEVARLIAPWWQQLEPGVSFKSTPGSGGWSTPTVRGDFKVAGDLCTNAKLWPFTVEVKRRENWSIATFFEGKGSKVWEWWRQAIKAAAEEDRTPLLWARKNKTPWLVLAPERALIPVLIRAGLQPDVVFGRLSPKIDTGDILPAVVMGQKWLSVAPSAWVPGRRRTSHR